MKNKNNLTNMKKKSIQSKIMVKIFLIRIAKKEIFLMKTYIIAKKILKMRKAL
jgi:hypothetical protein